MTTGVRLIVGFLLLCSSLSTHGQRSYAPSSVLSSGTWFRIAVKDPGIYRIDLAYLQSIGVNTQNLASGSLRLFGNGGAMLSEANNGDWTDDLTEVAIQVDDGGDGILNGNDQVLFYAPGPHHWEKDSLNRRFIHRQNLYSDRSFYFLGIGGSGKRVNTIPATGSSSITVNSYDGRYFYELDTFNFLSSGKEWYGEEFASAPGKSLARNFMVRLVNALPGTTLQLISRLLSRSVGNAGVFNIKLNGQPSSQLVIPPVNGGIYDPVANEQTGQGTGTAISGDQSVEFNYVPGSFNAQGWLNWFELFYRGNLSVSNLDQLMFRDWNSVNSGAVEFVISGASANTRVWDMTDPSNPVNLAGTFINGTFRFTSNTDRLREYVAFNPTGYLRPLHAMKIENQDLHQASPADLIIVTHPVFVGMAQRIANLHTQHQGLRTVIASTEKIYHEFSSGIPDPTAIRDFVKMYFDKYGGDPANKPKYLLLLGDASYDPKEKIFPQRNVVPAFQNSFSLDPLNSYVSDDFFGYLEDHEDINSGVVLNLLDLGIGRIPAFNVHQVKDFVDKLELYLSKESLGPWRTNLAFVADDEDNNLHLQDAEQITATAQNTSPIFNIHKIYLDAYFQESGAGGSRYPQANQASNNQIFNGTLIWNYNGHGGPRRLAEETVLDQEAADHWNNGAKLPLFITATCDFAPYDNPSISSIGESILLRPDGGAIALMTTTRVVFAFSNRIMNDNYIRYALERDASGNYRTLGDAVREAKNFTYQNFGDITNNRKFTLLGDPALLLAFPKHRTKITSVNQVPATIADTLSATEEVVVEGEVTDGSGNLLAGFDGTVYPSVYDKGRSIQTIGNDPASPVTSFLARQNILFRGRATVTAGRFRFAFRVPKDISLAYGNGHMSVYAENGQTDAAGVFDQFIVGGTGSLPVDDDTGPEIRAYLNDEMFVNGGTVNEVPVLIIKLSDSSGINTTGLGIGHDLVATLDHDSRQYFILNDFYQSDQDDHTRGVAKFQLPVLSPGMHTLTIKAWDAMNNSGEVTIEFVVAKDEELVISHVLNYPNPFTSATQFWFEHNRPGQVLTTQLQIMTMTGRVVKTFSQNLVTPGNRYAGFDWDGRDEFGDRLGRGVYLYRLRVTDPNGLKKEVLEKLVIF